MKNYQNIVVDGREYGEPSRIGSAFWGEGKWKHFIEPFLPDDCSEMTFLEFGCNYGLFLKLAQERGFETVLGVESNTELRDVTTRYLGRADQVLHTKITEKIFRDTFVADLPAADFVLMANFHYHLHASLVVHLLNLLRRKTRYAIVVSVEQRKRRRGRARPDIQAVRRYFRGWKEVDRISGIPTDGDPDPRGSLYSVLFKTDVERVPLADIPWGRASRRKYVRVMRACRESGRRYPQTYPCVMKQDGSLDDGCHRLATQELEGATTALVEKM